MPRHCMKTLFVVWDHLLFFIQGSDLFSLSLTCRTLHHKITSSKQWKHLHIAQKLKARWKYGMMVFNGFLYSLDQKYLFDQYFASGLPMMIDAMYFLDNNAIFKDSLWVECIEALELTVPKLTLLAEGPVFKGLRELSFEGVNSKFQLNPRIQAQFPNLERLCIDTMAESLSECTPLLTTFSNVRYLAIQNAIVNCVLLRDLIHLETLILHDIQEMRSLYELNTLLKLKSVTLSGNVVDLACLDEFEQLTELELNLFNESMQNVTSPKKGLLQLKQLTMFGTILSDLEWITQCPLLEKAVLTNCGLDDSDLNVFSACVNVIWTFLKTLLKN
jgi:hypothetical protein